MCGLRGIFGLNRGKDRVFRAGKIDWNFLQARKRSLAATGLVVGIGIPSHHENSEPTCRGMEPRLPKPLAISEKRMKINKKNV
jgi:hypothetical protein